MIGILGILKAGAGYTPLARDGSWPLERINHIIHRCRAKVVVTDVPVLPGIVPPILNVKSFPGRAGSEIAICSAHPGCTAYILWTSGTTGEPKGVEVAHAAAVACISNISRHVYPRRPSARVLQFSSPIFDASLNDCFGALALGATICMMPRSELLEDLQRAVAVLRPTVACLTPSVALLLDPESAQLVDLVLVGEAMTQAVKDKFTGSRTTLINGYGPAEINVA